MNDIIIMDDTIIFMCNNYKHYTHRLISKIPVSFLLLYNVTPKILAISDKVKPTSRRYSICSVSVSTSNGGRPGLLGNLITEVR